MPTILFQNDDHQNLLLEESNAGSQAVQANQHLIIHGREAMILDPGGHKAYRSVLSQTFKALRGGGHLRYVFLSHQDPDIVAAINGWLMTTEAEAWVSAMWTRFVPHFGIDKLVIDRLKGIPDGGMRLPLGDSELVILPAHYLHSSGNFQVYDPISRVLYTGDLGASIGQPTLDVDDFDAHIPYMEAFHRRYMPSTAALRSWIAMVRTLDVQTVAPQHGAMLRGPELVGRFLDWLESLEVGVDYHRELFTVPV